MNYETFKQRGQDGRLGKIAKFWIAYLDLIKCRHMAIGNENLCLVKYAVLLLLL